jgi:hypothetical protein
MIARLFLTAAILLAIMLFLRHFDRIRASLKRFDDENRRRQEDEVRDKGDDLAHFRHTVKAAEERVEKIHEIIERDGRTQYLFHGKVYETKREAEAARAEAVRAIARQFYMDLPRALSERKDDGKLN